MLVVGKQNGVVTGVDGVYYLKSRWAFNEVRSIGDSIMVNCVVDSWIAFGGSL